MNQQNQSQPKQDGASNDPNRTKQAQSGWDEKNKGNEKNSEKEKNNQSPGPQSR